MRKLLLIALFFLLNLSSSLRASGGVAQSPFDPNSHSNDTAARAVISIAGDWEIKLDPKSSGISEKWFSKPLSGISGKLPGTTYENKLGTPPAKTLNNYRAALEYKGCAWYQKDIDIPKSWKGKYIALSLERVSYISKVWIDDQYIGSVQTFSIPHLYENIQALKPGHHVITLMIDNTPPSNLIGSHHFYVNWNGVIGKMALSAYQPVAIAAMQTYPNIKSGSVKIKLQIKNYSGEILNGKVTFQVYKKGENKVFSVNRIFPVTIGKSELTDKEFTVVFNKKPALWDEFNPNLYTLNAVIEMGKQPNKFFDADSTSFGMRELDEKNNQFTLNGNTLFIRGTNEDNVHPTTGYPPANLSYWFRLCTIAKSYGMNQLRFHSWCPPQAAFDAADQTGMIFQVELPYPHASAKLFPEAEPFLQQELLKILSVYGNHPSFALLSMGNELLEANQTPAKSFVLLNNLVAIAKKTDSRHLYTATSHPYTANRNDDFYESAYGKWDQDDILGIRWGGGSVIYTSRFNMLPPATDIDYSKEIAGINAPVIAHEVGQWEVYPNIEEIKKYPPTIRPVNLELLRDTLEKKHMTGLVKDMVSASGQLTLALYKEEIESALRTPGFGGFNLLDLHDYPGQGTSMVGILDAFWDTKGLIKPEKFSEFCGPVVPLAFLKKRVFTQNEGLRAKITFANYSKVTYQAAKPLWNISDATGNIVLTGRLDTTDITAGGLSCVGYISTPLVKVVAPGKFILSVELPGTSIKNTWDIWVYPAPGKIATQSTTVKIIRGWNEQVKKSLDSGESVLLLPNLDEIPNSIAGCFTTIFWNPIFKNRQLAKTMGIMCDATHKAFQQFPTDSYQNWQWWDLVTHSKVLNLDHSTVPDPLIRLIDAFTTNRRLGTLFETKVGHGKLMVCTMDIYSDLDDRPVAKQLRYSLLQYMESSNFAPVDEMSLEDVKKLVY